MKPFINNLNFYTIFMAFISILIWFNRKSYCTFDNRYSNGARSKDDDPQAGSTCMLFPRPVYHLGPSALTQDRPFNLKPNHSTILENLVWLWTKKLYFISINSKTGRVFITAYEWWIRNITMDPKMYSANYFK